MLKHWGFKTVGLQDFQIVIILLSAILNCTLLRTQPPAADLQFLRGIRTMGEVKAP